jgi:hypothetical protein
MFLMILLSLAPEFANLLSVKSNQITGYDTYIILMSYHNKFIPIEHGVEFDDCLGLVP